MKTKFSFLKYYYEMCNFSIALITIGVELSIILNIFTIFLFSSYDMFTNQIEIIHIADSLGSAAQRVLFGSVLIGLVTDIVKKIEDRKKQQN